VDTSLYTLTQILFLFCFTLHNAEEAMWLPAWSQHAAKYHPPVGKAEFGFAVVVITILGYLLTGLNWLLGPTVPLFQYTYFGFVGMMGLNSIFPHGLATLVLRRYAPGFLTGILLNFPLSIVLIYLAFRKGYSVWLISVAILICSVIVLTALPFLFRIGEKWVPGEGQPLV
jgi:hypothetical protein